MLLFNDEKFEVPKQWKADFKKKHGSLTKKLDYRMDKRFDYYDKVNQKVRRTNSQSIEAFFVYTHNDEQGVLRYALHKIPGKKDEAAFYKPEMLSFESNSFLFEEDKYVSLELYYFLDKNPRNRANNPDNPIFYLEDIPAENKTVATGKRDKVKAYNMIWDEDNGLSIDELIDIGMALGFAGVKQMDEDGVRNRLDNFISTPTQADRNPSNTFIAAYGGATTAVKALIQEAIDADMLYFNLGKRTWSFSGSHEKADQSICNVKGGGKQVDELAEYFLKNERGGELLSYIEITLEEIKKSEPV